MCQVTVHEAQTQLSSLIQKALLGEDIIIGNDKAPLVKLVPVHLLMQSRQIGLDKGLVEIAADFNAPLDDFKEYMP
jgi:antitoxin (DNA-binding transcriptional repressor) of toxin-antitoxin stability system